MKTIIYNSDNLKETDIDEIVTRVKVFIVNSKNELLLATSGGGCQFPGGHREDGESIIDTVIREITEETGIILERAEIIEPFFEIKHYSRNYKNSGKNRSSEMVYFYVNTDKKINMEKIHLTEHEKESNFELHLVPLNEVEKFINSYIYPNQAELNIIIAKEMLVALKNFKEYFKIN